MSVVSLEISHCNQEVNADDQDGASGLRRAQAYGAAKSRQDIEAALSHCTEDITIETVALGTVSHGRAAVKRDLEVFFEMFPDYEFRCEGAAVAGSQVAVWGRACMTWSGRLPRTAVGSRWFRRRPRRVELVATAVYDLRDGKLCRERFVFDAASLGQGLGLSPRRIRRLAASMERKRERELGEFVCEHSTLVRAPLEEVYRRGFADVGALLGGSPRFPVRATRIELVGRALEAGAIRRVHLSNGHVMDELIESADEGSIHYRITNGFGRPFDALVCSPHGVHSLEPAGAHTLVRWRAHCAPRHPFGARVAQRAFHRIVGGTMERFHRSLHAMF